MADNVQKTPLVRSLNRFAENKIADAIAQLGKSLPCSIVSTNGWIVTVKFELTNIPFTLPNVTVPVAYPEYCFIPFQAGDKGEVMTADAYLGGISGLGDGTADLSQLANLSNLVFVPVGNKSWAPTDPNKIELWGPNGFLVRDKDSTFKIIGDKNAGTLTIAYGSNTIVLSASEIICTQGSNTLTLSSSGIQSLNGSNSVTVSSSGIEAVNGSNSMLVNSSGVTIDGTTTIESRDFLAHTHSGVTTGSGTTGGVV